jgi:hypothetical protein
MARTVPSATAEVVMERFHFGKGKGGSVRRVRRRRVSSCQRQRCASLTKHELPAEYLAAAGRDTDSSAAVRRRCRGVSCQMLAAKLSFALGYLVHASVHDLREPAHVINDLT